MTSYNTNNTTSLTTNDLVLLFSPAAIRIDRWVSPVWYAIGIITNILSAIIWLSRRMRANNSSVIYLATLSLTDLLFLMLHPLQEMRYAWGVSPAPTDYPGVCESYMVVFMTTQYLSPTLVLAFTIERYISICHPYSAYRYCTRARAMKAILLSLLVCFLLSIMQAYLWTYQPLTGSCQPRPEAMKALWPASSSSFSSSSSETVPLVITPSTHSNMTSSTFSARLSNDFLSLTTSDASMEENISDHSLWSIWTWTTELTVFLVLPLVILVFNLLVIAEVRRLASPVGGSTYTGNTATGNRRDTNPSKSAKNLQRDSFAVEVHRKGKHGEGEHTGKENGGAATTVMLLSVSFYMIVTTLPATLMYALFAEFPEGIIPAYVGEVELEQLILGDPAWTQYFRYILGKKVVDEICLSHYACNFFVYLITGAQFRQVLVSLGRWQQVG